MSARARGAVLTGLGVIAPGGVGTDAFWKATREGISFLDRLTREGSENFPVRVAGQIRGFDPATMIEERLLVQT
ncbi:ketosynthase chain-length factor, partial [Streptomyces sp. 2MCAF27]